MHMCLDAYRCVYMYICNPTSYDLIHIHHACSQTLCYSPSTVLFEKTEDTVPREHLQDCSDQSLFKHLNKVCGEVPELWTQDSGNRFGFEPRDPNNCRLGSDPKVLTQGHQICSHQVSKLPIINDTRGPGYIPLKQANPIVNSEHLRP